MTEATSLWRSEYDPMVRAYIRRISRGSVRAQDVDDIRHQVVVRFLEAQRSTRAKYDSSRGGVSNYLFWMTRSVCINQFGRNGRDPLNRLQGEVWLDLSETYDRQQRLLPSENPVPALNARITVESLENRLSAYSAAGRYTLGDIWRWLLDGDQGPEMAERLGVKVWKARELAQRTRALARQMMGEP